MIFAALILTLTPNYYAPKSMPIMNVANTAPLVTPMKLVEPFSLPSNDYCDMTPDDFPCPLPQCEWQVNVECFFECCDQYRFAIAANISAACQAYTDAEEMFDDCYTDAEIEWTLCCLTCIPLDLTCYSQCAVEQINDEYVCDTAFVAQKRAIKLKFNSDNAAAMAAAQA